MISSTVIPLGGDVSSSPSCAKAGRAAATQPRNMAIKSVLGDEAMRNVNFILLVYRNMVRKAGRQTAARLPPTPLRSAKPEDRALQFCRYLRCQTRVGVAVEENQQRTAALGISGVGAKWGPMHSRHGHGSFVPKDAGQNQECAEAAAGSSS